MRGRCFVTLLFSVACPPPVLCPGGSASPVRVELVENGAPFSERDAVLFRG